MAYLRIKLFICFLSVAGLFVSYNTIHQSVLRPRQQKQQDLPVIKVLLWGQFHSSKLITKTNNELQLQRECTQCRCQFTHRREDLAESDAVVFDVRNYEMTDEGYYPRHRQGQYWVIYNQEPLLRNAHYYSRLPAGVFNLSAHYMRRADIPLLYGQCERRQDQAYIMPGKLMHMKKGLVVWHVSHCNDFSLRMTYVNRLKHFIKVDVYGSCSSSGKVLDQRQRVGQGMTEPVKDNINRYKFYLAFENAFCDEYVTEKVFKILQDDIHTVPVVRGNGPYEGILPPHSYIDARDYTPKQLAAYLKKLDNDDALYMQYFTSRHVYRCDNYAANKQVLPCMICDVVAGMKNSNTRQVLTQKHLDRLFSKKDNCYSPDNMRGDNRSAQDAK